MSQNREYELVYIVSPERASRTVTDLHTQIEQIVQRFNGTIDKTENWGRRKLAYEIGHAPRGHLRRRDHHAASGELMKEIDRRLRVTDTVIRHLIVRVDEDLRVADRTARRAQGDAGAAPDRARPAARAGSRRAARRPRHADDEDDRLEGVEVQR